MPFPPLVRWALYLAPASFLGFFVSWAFHGVLFVDGSMKRIPFIFLAAGMLIALFAVPRAIYLLRRESSTYMWWVNILLVVVSAIPLGWMLLLVLVVVFGRIHF